MHEAADGPLARVRVPGGVVSAAQLRELAAAADELGSGVIELTSRANVQVRGLRSPAAFAARIAAAGLLPSPAHERVRNIVASPLGGRGPSGALATEPLVAALDTALCATPGLAGLPGRFLFALDDGTGDAAGLGADVTFGAGGLLLAGTGVGFAAGGPFPAEGLTAGSAVPRPGAGTAGPPHPAGRPTPTGDPVTLMIAAAEAFLAERGDDGAWRIAELTGGPARIAARLGGATTGEPAPGPAPRRAGPVGQRDGRVALEAVVPLGRLSPAQARALAGTARPVRLTPWRTVVLLDVDARAVEALAGPLEDAGLVTDPASPWVGVTACTGRPGCAKSLADVQADAARWAAGRDRAPAVPVHWAGCERRCGLPRGRVTQMVATGEGYEERQ
ncbi:precorrin-3B synthase [Sphaerisporangium sp. TRM90804]|uniref:precorrin-3B synthase n=1 Tax=Sphaerisporangium sp. TRM90804 TaxID=3031113 RepID=UPI00244C2CE0|nr:precorrin-3B synthase [Sphaerisporangium sp. TRM90804]